MKERDLQSSILELARHLQWLCYHTFDSRRSAKGFPDLVLVHHDHGILYRELKAGKYQATQQQAIWLSALSHAGANARVWREEDWTDGRILAELRGDY